MASASSLVFTVRRREPELIAPAMPTPHELKYLSDIDDQEGLRFHIPIIQFYRNDVSMAGKDPADVIRKAIANTLVYYYPFAGRLREGNGRKLIVDCTGEGVMFMEAETDVCLNQFGDALQPPFPCLEELIYDVPGSGGVLNCPLLLIQVTRLSCGGFIFGIRFNHTMCDGQGLVQFMSALGEISRGEPTPSVLPVWQREIFSARDPPRVTFPHREYDIVSDTRNTLPISLDDVVQRSFFFSRLEIDALKKHVPPHLGTCSTFEILTACLWKCRTMAMNPNPKEDVRMICPTSVRGKLNPPLPDGYYGNAFAFPVAISTAEKLCQNSLGYAIELVKKAKNQVNDEYMRSVADLMVIKGRPHFATVRAFLLSDVTRVGFIDVVFGWGKAVYGGPAYRGIVMSFYLRTKNSNGEDGILVPICLPEPAMEKFVIQIETVIKEPAQDGLHSSGSRSKYIRPAI